MKKTASLNVMTFSTILKKQGNGAFMLFQQAVNKGCLYTAFQDAS